MKATCMICGQKVEKDKRYAGEYSCNGAMVGPYFAIKGHPMCVENVNQLVVIPNRMRVIRIEKRLESYP
jgi:hypothetical protein